MTGKRILHSERLAALGEPSCATTPCRLLNNLKLLALLVGGFVLGTSATRMFAAPAPPLTKTNAPSATATNVTAISSSEIPAQSESALGNIRAAEAQARPEEGTTNIDHELSGVAEEIADRSDEDSRILSHSTSLDLFARLESS